MNQVFRRFLLKRTHWVFFAIIVVIISMFVCFGVVMRTYMESIKDSIATKMETQERNIDHLKAGISQDDVRRRNIVAAEKIIEKVNKSIPYPVRLEYASFIVDEVERMPKVDLSLALAVATAESKFVSSAETYITVDGVKHVNAAGIYQIVPGTAQWIATELGIPYSDSTRYDPRTNIKMGIWYIQNLLGIYYGNTELALAHYANGSDAAESWSNRKLYSSSSEYKGMSRDNIIDQLDKLTKFNTSDTGSLKNFSRDEKVDKLIGILSAKELPAQAEAYVPKVMALRKTYQEYFKTAEIYFTPANKAVVDTTPESKK